MGNICSCFTRKKDTSVYKQNKNFGDAFELDGNSEKPPTGNKTGQSPYSKPVPGSVFKQFNHNEKDNYLNTKPSSESKILVQNNNTGVKFIKIQQQKQLVKNRNQYQIDPNSCLQQQNISNVNKGRKVITSMTHSSRQIYIRQCKKSKIYILDITKEIKIDKCSDCLIFCAPCSGKITISNSKNLQLTIISSKLDIIKCKQCEVSLFCSSSPVLIKSSQICFSNFPQVGYYDLIEQLNRCELEVWNNLFLEVEDMDKNMDEEHYFQKKFSNVDVGLDQILTEQCFEKADPIIPLFWRDLKLRKRNIVLIMNEPIREIENKVLRYIVSRNISIYKSFKGRVSGVAVKRIKRLFPYHQSDSYLCLIVGKELETSGLEAYFDKVEGEDGADLQKLIFPEVARRE